MRNNGKSRSLVSRVISMLLVFMMCFGVIENNVVLALAGEASNEVYSEFSGEEYAETDTAYYEGYSEEASSDEVVYETEVSSFEETAPQEYTEESGSEETDIISEETGSVPEVTDPETEETESVTDETSEQYTEGEDTSEEDTSADEETSEEESETEDETEYATYFTYEDGSVLVEVTLADEEAMPAGAVLEPVYDAAELQSMDSLLNEWALNNWQKVNASDFYKFVFVYEGEQIVPECGANVTISYMNAASLEGEGKVEIVILADSAFVTAADNSASENGILTSVVSGAFNKVNAFAAARINDIPKQRVYTYNDGNVMVTATLTNPEAVPDNADFRVTPVTAGSAGYNYDAYMQAMNDAEEQITAAAASDEESKAVTIENADEEDKPTFNDENTLLYDIAFMVQKTDELGNPIEGEWYEYQPKEGSVLFEFVFLANQITNETNAEKSSDVVAVHLPLGEEVKESVDSTAEATAITSDSINVEVVDVDVAGVGEATADKATFSLDDMSVVALASLCAAEFEPGEYQDFLTILGGAVQYAIVANQYTKNAHVDCNWAVKEIIVQASETNGNGAHAKVTVNPYINAKITPGENQYSHQIVNEILFSDECVVYCAPEDVNKVHQNKGGSIIQIDRSILNTVIDNMMAGIGVNVPSEDEYDITGGTELDLTQCEPGTYYFNIDEIVGADGRVSTLTVKKKGEQTIVFTSTKEKLSIPRFNYWVDGQNITINASRESEPIAKTVIWNLPNATNVNFIDSFAGVLIAKGATIDFVPVSCGWIVADKITQNQSEWHGVWSGFTPAPIVTATGQKYLNNQKTNTPFTFKVERYDQIQQKWVDFKTVKSGNNGVITIDGISAIDWLSPASSTYLRVAEVDDDYNYSVDLSQYIIKVDSDGSISYYRGSSIDSMQQLPAKTVPEFYNTNKTSVTIQGTKVWVNDNPATRPEKITVKLQKKYNGNWVDVSGYSPQIIKESDNWTYTFSGLPKANGTDIIIYRVIEDVPEDYTVSYANVLQGTIEVMGENQQNYTAYLVQKNSSGTEVNVDSKFVVNPNENIKFSLTGQPYEDENGNKYTYYIKGPNGRITTNEKTYAEGTTKTITNTGKPKVKLTIEKVVSGPTAAEYAG
ncbi:MAG: Cna B-type domain-containing protein, partial [Parasporobacterium sp.]|nr:Cna B-type domain-containing protein [Parasporobacterium sp.]